MPIEISKVPEKIIYYDRDGNGISIQEWIKLLEDPKYKIVKVDLIKETRISTVWLGLDHSFDLTGPPILFETMDFPENNLQIHYYTEQEAIEGHNKLVGWLIAGGKIEDYVY